MHKKLFCRKLEDNVPDGEYGGCGGPRCGTQVCCCWGMVGAITYEQSDLVNIRERYKICIVRTWAATLLIVQRAKFWLVCLLTSSLIFRKALIGGEVLYNCAECPHPDKPPTDETVCVDPATIGCWPALYQSKVTSFTILYDVSFWISDWKRSHETSFVICGRQYHQLFEISVLRPAVSSADSPASTVLV